jgi:pimeloyl-ACP methyl ester carboxylesterase
MLLISVAALHLSTRTMATGNNGEEETMSVGALAEEHESTLSKFVTLKNGLKVHYQESTPSNPAGPALLLIHGGSMSLFSWEPWVRRLGPSVHVVSVDLPGHGLTEAPVDFDYSIAAFADFIDLFTRTIGLNKGVILAGHSMGGHIAWRFVLAHRERLAGLVLISPGGTTELGGPQGRSAQLVRKPGGALLLRMLFSRDRMAEGLKTVVSNKSAITPGLIERQWEFSRRPGAFEAMVARLRSPSFEPAMVARLNEISVPALVMWGRNDVVFPVSESAKFAEAIPSAKLIIYDQCGHWPAQELPDQTAADLEDFVASLRSSRS